MSINLFSAVRVDHGDIRTVTSAERAIIRASVDIRWYGPTHPTAAQWATDIETLLLAISVTTGETSAAILERLAKSIDRSFARQTREGIAQAKRLGWPLLQPDACWCESSDQTCASPVCQNR